jgi:hypothetical protein
MPDIDDNIGPILQQALSGLPRDGLRARIAARRRRRRRRVAASSIGGLLVLIALPITTVAVRGDETDSVVAGHDLAGSRVCESGRLDVLPSWLPEGWTEELSAGFKAWAGPDGETLVIQDAAVVVRDGEPVTVAGHDAVLGTVRFEDLGVGPYSPDAVSRVVVSAGSTAGGCAFAVVATDVDRNVLRRIAEHLVVDGAAFGMWPWWSPRDALVASQSDVVDDPGSRDPMIVARRFAERELDWPDATAELIDEQPATATVSLSGPTWANDAVVLLRKSGPEIWNVYSVSSLSDDDAVTVDLNRESSDGSTAGTLSVEVDTDLDYTTADTSFFSGGIGATGSDGPSEALDVGWSDGAWDNSMPGRVLALFRAADGRTVGAWGTAVPSGDYRATFDGNPDGDLPAEADDVLAESERDAQERADLEREQRERDAREAARRAAAAAGSRRTADGYGYEPFTPLLDNEPRSVPETTVFESETMAVRFWLTADAYGLSNVDDGGSGSMSGDPMYAPAVAFLMSGAPPGSDGSAADIVGVARAEVAAVQWDGPGGPVSVDTITHPSFQDLRFFVIRAPDGLGDSVPNLRAYSESGELLTDTDRIKDEESGFEAVMHQRAGMEVVYQRVDSYTVEDGTDSIVILSVYACGGDAHARWTETENGVRVRVEITQPIGADCAGGALTDLRIGLDGPLDHREVVDGTTNQPVPPR